jgi:YidC/Oxa1 family membrane protein insertase
MKKRLTRFLLFAFSLIIVINVSGCAKIYREGNTGEIYPLNYDDYFWDRVFVQPVAWLLNFFTSSWGSYALAILLTTLIVRTLLMPVYTKSNDMSKKMQLIQPDIKKIQEKYAGKTDPESRNKMSFEMMKLYKDNDVHMFLGCLMPFLQMPVFLAMYNAVVKAPVTYNYKASNLTFLHLNLSQPDPYYILPILVGITMFVLQQISMYGLSPEAKNNSTMKIMLYFMPIMMLMFSFTQASALSLYWVIGNIYSTLQIIIFKNPFKKNKDDNVVKAKYKEVK